jgi:hypothetical protein
VIDMMNAQGGAQIRTASAVADKYVRAQPVSAAWNAGRVLVPRAAPWLDAFISEVVGFSGVNDAHDDQVDALAAAFDALAKSQRGEKANSIYADLERQGFQFVTTHDSGLGALCGTLSGEPAPSRFANAPSPGVREVVDQGSRFAGGQPPPAPAASPDLGKTLAEATRLLDMFSRKPPPGRDD